MDDEQLIAKKLFERLVEVCIVLLVAIGILALTGQSVTPRVIDSAETVEFRATAPLDSDSAWGEAETLDFADLPDPQTDAWLRWSPARELPRDRPLAIQMGGPFSADVYFNGVLIGSKGVPGYAPHDEQAGQIDGLFAIPSGLIGDEGNRVMLHYSSHHAGYQPAILFQTLSILPYRDDARRPLRYYGPIILVAGALAGLTLLAAHLSRARKYPPGQWLIIALTGLLIAGGAEISRALINYPYDWHQPRQAIQLTGFFVFGASLLRYGLLRWSAPPRWLRLVFWGAVLLAATGVLASSGYDARSAIAIGLLAGAAGLWSVWTGFRTDQSAVLLAIPLVAIAVYSQVAPGDLLDRGAYLLATILFGHALLRHDFVLVPLPVEVAKPKTLAVTETGRTRFLPIEAILFLKAAGNYTEIHSLNNAVTLDGRGLSQVLNHLPETFQRVHRSWAVNLDVVDALHTYEGSRYELSLTVGRQIPVGRKHVQTLRALL
ncbi:LytTR family DNA-binding domain-containing protein [Maricaulis salignorans]|uniref:LytTr DNA-binding domain-containing protein n=1 Tax=Maricaulis salignorans TaxID=144026 RepID=A0A1G9SD91_9PROT|nr:LytTR family DNA-binding domain-containing protein [Maricaulis salignorans]SDM33290.1 LytTr DNA-binding domain-containing protein [Maricaulis salignorans]